MSQHDMSIANALFPTLRGDINDALAALVSQNSGATEPATMFAYQWWADTTTGLLKIRNAANSAWITVGTLASVNLGLAVLAGSASQVFSVAAATAAAHAVRADQIQGASLTAFTTGGTGTAFTLTPTPAITDYTANQTFDVIFSAACGAAPTLAISGVATPPNLVRQLLDGSYQNLASGDFPSGWQSPIKLVSATQALVMKLPGRIKRLNSTRDMTAASGSVAYTGLGFKPRKITAYVSVGGTAPSSNGSGNSSAQSCLVVGTSSASSGVGAAMLIQIQSTTAGAKQEFVLTSEDVDGFTGTWTKTNTPAAGTAGLEFICEE